MRGQSSICGDLSIFLQGMSGTLDHSPSMDLSDLRRSEGSGGPHSVLQPTGGGPHQQHSPLQHFVQVWLNSSTTVFDAPILDTSYCFLCFRQKRRSMRYSWRLKDMLAKLSDSLHLFPGNDWQQILKSAFYSFAFVVVPRRMKSPLNKSVVQRDRSGTRGSLYSCWGVWWAFSPAALQLQQIWN